MTIREELAEELKDAMRAKDGPRRDVIRQVETEVAVARSHPGFEGEVDDELYRSVIASYVKKMDKARDEYLEIGERGAALADKLGFEVEYLSRWLPSKLDERATRDLVKGAIAELGVAGDEKATGRVIGHLMKTHGKDLDGGLVNRLVREELAPD
ncbi:MAG TPA: GatB/YqeY domain-containing protein [Acidimicrobiia bacterium]|nr:GatB/YqeY domain-containing protein [Acidimicrobiia bacterium]